MRKEKGVKFGAAGKESKKPGSFFASIKKDEEWNVTCGVQFAEGGTDIDPEDFK